ncbi:recombination regulator RecX [Salmonella enterica]|uniref:Regulatory protein RecX n=11 Tax=Salmonella enterica TaxID=28901 RepID=RECX_SALAR|nr:recombination regulator RecX [Salmonella enterica]A9MFY9.1 RecName: Full=Regulatory protein RecX [Salmonella enterica subsp. arizonae serovar 62:z4,z23:-]AIP94123.1 recombination protein RecX [Salmonella enterica subsp. arizonae serovar 62:z36:- str. RKS2983]ASO62417.1 regulatory protein RecX [Salmonella enterica subsp. arizonae serovar 53:-:- str. SA20100345]AXC76051.1 recombination regulator RecX [Salmonella enterica subsp. arizonae serovar 63:g,z51:-]EAN8393511.1 recombination regulator 
MSEPTPRRPAYARLLDRAVRILAVRDHSEQELRRKLSAPVMGKNGPEEIDATPDDYERVISWCHEHHYLDDNRFVIRFIASRSRKGYGPARIRQELNQKGIARESTEKAMRECDIDWSEMAREQAVRKYGEPLPSTFSEKVKVQRFLLYRGYLMDDIQEIWRNFAD